MSAPVDPSSNARRLTRDEVQRELQRVDYAPAGELVQAARHFAARLGTVEGGDMLNEAVKRALASRQCPANVTAEQFLHGIMRSVASSILRARARREVHEVAEPVEEIADRLAIGGYVCTAPDEILYLERARQLCDQVLERLANGSDAQSRLIDGIGLDLRGAELAEWLGVTTRELATMRKALKRQAERLWLELEGDLAAL